MILINSYKFNFYNILSNIFFFPTHTTDTVTRRRLTAKQAHVLPSNEKIELPYYGTTGQPTTDAAIPAAIADCSARTSGVSRSTRPAPDRPDQLEESFG